MRPERRGARLLRLYKTTLPQAVFKTPLYHDAELEVCQTHQQIPINITPVQGIPRCRPGYTISVYVGARVAGPAPAAGSPSGATRIVWPGSALDPAG